MWIYSPLMSPPLAEVSQNDPQTIRKRSQIIAKRSKTILYQQMLALLVQVSGFPERRISAIGLIGLRSCGWFGLIG